VIAIVDTGGANLASVLDALERWERKAVVTDDAAVIADCSHVILPGVGAAGDSMDRLRRAELIVCLRELKQPTLGICLGMQLLFSASREGDTACLGVLPGTVSRLPDRDGFPVPHMGWNQLQDSGRDNPLLRGISPQSHFYFVHSFIAPDGDWVTAHFDYGGRFPAMVQRENFFGAQFHPEKSARAGARLLRNFIEL
jgi:glutamine amidotransferase